MVDFIEMYKPELLQSIADLVKAQNACLNPLHITEKMHVHGTSCDVICKQQYVPLYLENRPDLYITLHVFPN